MIPGRIEVNLIEPLPPERPELEDTEACPWEHPDAIRRDCEPHRGRFLRPLSTFAMVVGGLSLAACFLFVPALLSMTLGALIYVLARRDLVLMNLGHMDRQGWLDTLTAVNNSRLAILCSAISLFMGGVWIVVVNLNPY
jgi:hypothetical protein